MTKTQLSSNTTFRQHCRDLLPILGGVIAAALIFFLAVLAEAYLRSFQMKPIPVVFEGQVPAKVSASVMPDLLWMGDAWRIKIETDRPAFISIDGEWTAAVPAGTHAIYHNHDTNNTDTYGPEVWQKTPSRITVRDSTLVHD